MKRLAKDMNNAKIEGVCSGIGKYIGIDPTVIRVAFVLFVLFGYVYPILMYILLMFLMEDE